MKPSTKRNALPARLRRNGPSEFSPGVFVGGWKDALRFDGSRFCVLDSAPDDMPAATHVRIYDGQADRAIVPNLDALVRAMRRQRAGGRPVLVFCGHGIRRSPLAAAWFLHRTEGLPLDEAYDRVAAVRPRVERAVEWMAHVDDLQAA